MDSESHWKEFFQNLLALDSRLWGASGFLQKDELGELTEGTGELREYEGPKEEPGERREF